MKTLRDTGIFLVLVLLIHACQKVDEDHEVNQEENMDVLNMPGDFADPQAVAEVKKQFERSVEKMPKHFQKFFEKKLLDHLSSMVCLGQL